MDEAGGVKSKHPILEAEDWRERFWEILAVMDTEQLMRFRHRLGKMGCERAVQLLSDEIAERER